MDATQRATRRARTLIDLMMKEMHASLRDPARLAPEQWDKLFGSKDSMIGNLQKLVATLNALPAAGEAGVDSTADRPMDAKEIVLLTSWLREQQD